MVDAPNVAAEKDLVSRCLAGEAAAWDALIRERGLPLSRALRQALRRAGVSAEPALVEDLLQDTFAELLRDRGAALGRFQWDCSLNHYLIAIALHQFSHWLRRRRPAISLEREAEPGTLYRDLLATGEQADPTWTLQVGEREERLREAMGKLSSRERLALHLFYWRAVPVNVLARILRLQPDSVRPHLMRARNRLAEVLRGHLFLP